MKGRVEKFFARKSERFWKDGILKLRERWKKVVEEEWQLYNSINVHRQRIKLLFSLTRIFNARTNDV